MDADLRPLWRQRAGQIITPNRRRGGRGRRPESAGLAPFILILFFNTAAPSQRRPSADTQPHTRRAVPGLQPRHARSLPPSHTPTLLPAGPGTPPPRRLHSDPFWPPSPRPSLHSARSPSFLESCGWKWGEVGSSSSASTTTPPPRSLPCASTASEGPDA